MIVNGPSKIIYFYQADMESIMRNRELAETRMMQVLLEFLFPLISACYIYTTMNIQGPQNHSTNIFLLPGIAGGACNY